MDTKKINVVLKGLELVCEEQGVYLVDLISALHGVCFSEEECKVLFRAYESGRHYKYQGNTFDIFEGTIDKLNKLTVLK